MSAFDKPGTPWHDAQQQKRNAIAALGTPAVSRALYSPTPKATLPALPELGQSLFNFGEAGDMVHLESMAQVWAGNKEVMNWRSPDGNTVLSVCAQNGLLKGLEVMLLAGADLNLADNDGDSPLYCAAYTGQHACLVKLLEAGANVNQVDTNGCTALSTACQEGHIDCARTLVRWGANVETADSDGDSPAMCAVVGNSPECLQLLLDSGASSNLDLALAKAKELGYNHLVPIFASVGCV